MTMINRKILFSLFSAAKAEKPLAPFDENQTAISRYLFVEQTAGWTPRDFAHQFKVNDPCQRWDIILLICRAADLSKSL